MEKLTDGILRHKKLILLAFAALTVVSAVLTPLVPVNYNVMDYLPDDAASTVAIDVMEKEYTQGIANARVMVRDISIPQALAMKEQLAAIEGIDEVTWLDDVADITTPLSMLDENIVDNYYRDNAALFSLTVNDEQANTALHQVRELVGEDAPMSGMRVNTVFASESINADIQKILLVAVPIILLILLLTTESWFEPLLFLVTIGVAIVINMGTNIFFGEISFITKGVASILQLAVSMDYAIFILHRFAECRRTGMDVEKAMRTAVSKSFGSVSASGVTTIVGFAALILMRIKFGPDIGWVMTKGIIISLLCVFTFLPSLTLLCYRLIDKTAHRSFMPDMRRFGRWVAKFSLPALMILALCVIPGYLAIQKNDFVYFDIFTDERTELGREAKEINETFDESTSLVLMVEKGDFATEKKLSDEIKTLPNVIGVTSYVDTVGAEVPEEYLPEDTRALLLSEHYSRMAITLDTYMESAETFHAVEFIRERAQEYYPDAYQLAGESCCTYDMKSIVEEDNTRINLIAIAAVFLILLLSFKSISAPVILILVIESAIWINCGIPYFAGDPLYYIGYLVISSLQLGATVDYAILFTNRYMEYRETLPKRRALAETSATASVSILTSGGILFVAGFILSVISSNGLLSQIGTLVGRGAVLSIISVLFCLPALLYGLDGLIQRTTLRCRFAAEDDKAKTDKKYKKTRRSLKERKQTI